ncbi:hypothetical protein [uncultured Microbacterium sp.]|uniref:hypothetical protein n=1 Tax=uncultured Microbacterium sp. TaxID=191216 RepID=UPI00262504B4|nr:hypothetical protein [uncultured Microbacterium sp.]
MIELAKECMLGDDTVRALENRCARETLESVRPQFGGSTPSTLESGVNLAEW